jgi:mycoredoxin-dependent peroxiredoxin
VLAISADSPHSHREYAARIRAPFPLLSDIHRAVCKQYGVWEEERNVAYRSSFVIDPSGVLRWGQAGDRHMVRDGTELLRVLDQMKNVPQT